MEINLEKWNKDRLETEEAIRALKHSIKYEPKPVLVYRQPAPGAKYEYMPTGAKYWGGSTEEYVRLEQLRLRATMLYKVRAQYRGRQHQLKSVYLQDGKWVVETYTKEQERETMGVWMEDYAIKEAA